MKTRFVVIAVGLVLTSALAWSPPAFAPPDICIGHGDATMQNNVFYPPPIVTPDQSAMGTATFRFNVGGCLVPGVHSNTVNAEFTDSRRDLEDLFDLGNYCGHSEGNVTIETHRGHWVSAGSMLTIYGGFPGINGVASAVPNALSGHSCLTGASSFLVTASVVLI